MSPYNWYKKAEENIKSRYSNPNPDQLLVQRHNWDNQKYLDLAAAQGFRTALFIIEDIFEMQKLGISEENIKKYINQKMQDTIDRGITLI